MDTEISPIALYQPSFVGEFRSLGPLGSRFDHQKLVQLVRGGQLCVSRDGTTMARIVTQYDGSSVIVLGQATIPRIRFDRVPQIVHVTTQSALVLGTNSGIQGLFLCTHDRTTQVGHGTELVGVQRSEGGTLVLTQRPGEDKRRLYIETIGQELSIHPRATATVLRGGQVLIMEPIGDRLHRYVVGPEGFDEVYPIPLASGDVPMGLVAWDDMFLLGVRRSDGSFLLALGPNARRLEKGRLSLVGSLEMLWQSPSRETYAALTRVGIGTQERRRLVVGNTVLHEREFSMQARDLAWSPSGRLAMACIREGMSGAGATLLVGRSEKIGIHSGRQVSEFALNNHGRLVARIEGDGRFDYPICYRAPHQTSEFAWNLQCSALGEVTYNRVMGDSVWQVIDRTFTRRHVLS